MQSEDLARCWGLAQKLLGREPLAREMEPLLTRCSNYREFRALVVLDGKLVRGLAEVANRWKLAVPSLDPFIPGQSNFAPSGSQVQYRLEGMERRLASLQQSVALMQTSLNDMRALVGPFGVAFPDGAMLVQTVFGLKYFIDPSDDIMAPQLVVYRQWEPDLSQFVWNSVDQDTVFVDIGANFGYFSCLAAARIGTAGKGHVIAVEPNPRMQTLLQRNVAINWSGAPVEIHRCAVADSEGEMLFNIPAGRAANAGLVAADQAAVEGDTRIAVATRTLSSLTAGRRIDLMKIDVEGHEAAVLKHLGPVLETSPKLCILMEWSPAQMLSAGYATEEVAGLLRNHGLCAYRIPPSRYVDEATLASLAIPLDDLPDLAYDNLMLTRAC